ncbi:hypothetical protein [Brevibacillus porteri]|uniref:hypothetical protein n=1 Tax=Brevibacillus porteri TaxID=2126350 RepID=UPI003D1F4C0D
MYDSAQREVLSGTTSRTDIKVDTSGTYYIKLLTGENAGEHQYYILKSIPLSVSSPQSYTIGPEKKIWYQVKAKANHTLRVYTPGLSGFGTGKYLYDDPNKAALKTVSLDTLTFIPAETSTYFVVVSGSSGKTFSITAGDGSDLNQAYSVSLDGIKGTIAAFSTPSNDSIFFRTELKAGSNYHLWGKGSSPIEGWVLFSGYISLFFHRSFFWFFTNYCRVLRKNERLSLGHNKPYEIAVLHCFTSLIHLLINFFASLVNTHCCLYFIQIKSCRPVHA